MDAVIGKLVVIVVGVLLKKLNIVVDFFKAPELSISNFISTDNAFFSFDVKNIGNKKISPLFLATYQVKWKKVKILKPDGQEEECYQSICKELDDINERTILESFTKYPHLFPSETFKHTIPVDKSDYLNSDFDGSGIIIFIMYPKLLGKYHHKQFLLPYDKDNGFKLNTKSPSLIPNDIRKKGTTIFDYSNKLKNKDTLNLIERVLKKKIK